MEKVEFRNQLGYLLWGIFVWFGIMLYLALDGAFNNIGIVQTASHVGLSVIVPMLLYYLWPAFRRLIAEINPYGLAYFHVWRIFAALVFFYYASQLPDTFVQRAAWGDLIAGVLAIVVYLLPRRTFYIFGFHFFGMVDLLLAVGTGIYLTIMNDPLMDAITHFPLVLIPLFGVPISAASHIMAFDMWIRKQLK